MKKEKAMLCELRLAANVISIVFSLFMFWHSYNIVFLDSLAKDDSSIGYIGMLCAIAMMIAGIFGICTLKAESSYGEFITGFLYTCAAILAFMALDEWWDLAYGSILIWGYAVLNFTCGVIHYFRNGGDIRVPSEKQCFAMESVLFGAFVIITIVMVILRKTVMPI